MRQLIYRVLMVAVIGGGAAHLLTSPAQALMMACCKSCAGAECCGTYTCTDGCECVCQDTPCLPGGGG